MRILMISDHADPLVEIGSKEAGGQNIYVANLASFLSRRGIFVDVYTRWDKKNKKEVIQINSHMRVIRVKAGPRRYMDRDLLYMVLDEFADHILQRIQREHIAYDILHTNYWFSGLIGLLIRKQLSLPHIHVYHSIGEVRFRTLRKYKQQSITDFFQRRKQAEVKIAKEADYIVATSPVEKKIIKRLFKISHQEKIITLPPGVDLQHFSPLSVLRSRRFLHLSLDAKVILYVGRIEWRKGIETLLSALHEVQSSFPQALLLIAGGGKSRAAQKLEQAERLRLEAIVRELHLESHVRFLGPVSQEKLPRYYSAADVTVVPSYYEPFGIVPVESMACGTPVVCSRTGGLKYSVKEGVTGFLATPKNAHDFAEKIVLVLKHGKERYAGAARQRAERLFGWERIVLQYEKIFGMIKRETLKKH